MTVLLIVALVLFPLLFIGIGALAIMKMQKRVIAQVSNTALEERLRRLQGGGVASTAQVLDAADTGNRIDAIYLLIRLDLQVAAAEGLEAFTGQIVVPLSPARVAQIVPGSTVKVRVDPVSREVVLDQPRM